MKAFPPFLLELTGVSASLSFSEVVAAGDLLMAVEFFSDMKGLPGGGGLQQ